MSATGSLPTKRLLTGGWVVFAGVNTVLMYVMPGRETIPFHLVWIALGLVYGFTRWSAVMMVSVLGAVAVTTGWVLAHHAAAGAIGWEETSEVPLMTALFCVMVWHVQRRQHTLAEVRRLAATDRRRLEAQQLFVRLCSHELRTPITVARGYTDLVRAANPDPRIEEDTCIVLDELDKLSRITHRLVTLMQMNEPPTLELVDLNADLARIVRRWEPTADRRWTVRAAVGVVYTDRERLETALDCLLENAVKFTAPGDLIAVTAWREVDSWLLEVADSGVGFLPAEVAELLDGEPGRKTPTGTGLGLAIVRAVVEARGGAIRIAARPGGGTVITLVLPLVCAVTAEAPRQRDHAAHDPAPTPAGS